VGTGVGRRIRTHRAQAVAYARRARGSRKRPTTGWDSLTPTELQVVELAAQGFTNPEIGRRLFIGAGTVSTQDVPAADYQKIRAEFAGSRWPDLRNAGTAYVDLATQLPTAQYTDGYQTVWFYQRLSAACAKHG
jgi:hypothetical protein